MERVRWIWLLLPPALRRFPADLAATVGLTLVTMAVVLVPVINETALRVVFGLPFVLFLPGYAFIAALFPEAGQPPTAESDTEGQILDRGIDGIERVALSFGLSIAIVPLIGLVLNFTPWGIRLVPILLSVAGFTIACTVAAHVRRLDLPAADRFAIPYRDWLASARREVFEPDDRIDMVLNIALALSIVLALGSVGYAITVPPDGERFTEFYILTGTDDGELVAANYPTDFSVGSSEEIVLGIENNEHETVTYTVLIQLTEETREGNETIVHDRSELDQFELELAHNETWREPIDVTPDRTGEDLRLQFLLYQGKEVPDEPDAETAYRDLHLWIDVDR